MLGMFFFHFLMWIFLLWLFPFIFEDISLLHFFLPISNPPSQACRQRCIWRRLSAGSELRLLSLVYALLLWHFPFTAPQCHLNWWLQFHVCILHLSLDSRPNFCATAYWTFPPGCPTGTSNSMSKTALSSSQAKPAPTCLISADDSSICLAAQAPQNSKFHRTMSVLVTANFSEWPTHSRWV